MSGKIGELLFASLTATIFIITIFNNEEWLEMTN